MIYANPVHKKDIFILQKATNNANPNKKEAFQILFSKIYFRIYFCEKGLGSCDIESLCIECKMISIYMYIDVMIEKKDNYPMAF